ncbi:MAG TPA: type II secretion system protein [Armatimonadaceae bacterium]|nr:type II secretion system protein [Armatimonadaceae bacterium]
MKFARSRRRRGAAFTLVEVMTAMMVFVVLTLLFATSLPVSRKTARMNGQYTQATSLCQHKIDQLRARGYGGLTYTELKNTGIIDATPITSPYSFRTIDGVGDVLPGAVTEIRVDAPTSADVPISAVRSNTKKVTVTIRWKKTTFETATSEMSLTALITQ